MGTLSEAFTLDALRAALAADRATLKHLITQQRPIAGIGNGYGDEILWEARLSPFARTEALTEEAIAALHAAIQGVLRRGVEENRAEFSDALPIREPIALYRVHHHGGEPCPRWGDVIRFVAYAERETYYCPTCQAQGKVFADRRLSRLLR
ncbi:MAG: hypothetical protein FJX78_00735 [Armatimonadetes bacterium]|nr:hypothetical protein [Armatimonadota bacterium]